MLRHCALANVVAGTVVAVILRGGFFLFLVVVLAVTGLVIVAVVEDLLDSSDATAASVCCRYYVVIVLLPLPLPLPLPLLMVLLLLLLLLLLFVFREFAACVATPMRACSQSKSAVTAVATAASAVVHSFTVIYTGVVTMLTNDISLAKITIKPRFENTNFKFYHKLIPKGAMMKIPT